MLFSALANGVKIWRDIKAESSEDKLKRKAAIGLVVEAVVVTKAYLYDKEHGNESRATERLLSERWQKAAIAIEDYDYELFRSAELKALGWADPREWIRAKGREHAIALNTILEQCEHIRSFEQWR